MCGVKIEENNNMNTKRGQIIKNVILQKCKEREIYGYTNLTDSDVTEILETLEAKNITLSKEEMLNLGFD